MSTPSTSGTVRGLFSAGSGLEQPIEKVINFRADSEEQLAREMREYVVTPRLERAFENLLARLDTGMRDGSPEVGVWISGFYGSGKSSLAKYLGLALDPERQVQGRPFLDHLVDRVEPGPLRRQFKAVATRHKPVVILLDMASDAFASAGGGTISEVLAARVMQWAGYARDPKMAQLELMLERDGKREAFEARFQEEARGQTWAASRDMPLLQRSIAARLAADFYPHVWPDPASFNAVQLQDQTTLADQAREVIELIRRRKGRENIVFVLDEVGQFVSASEGRITNLQGLAEAVKNLGQGKVWLVATAQQTLAQDNPAFQYNTSSLYKLKDRFPVSIDLEADDIRVICHRRLLGKSAQGQAALGAMYDQYGAQLRFLTRLQGRAYERTGFERDAFVSLYPFLPQHFDVLLGLLSRLARSTGGVGLRSAIRVIQDVLVGREGDALANAPAGTLATAVTFYDALRNDLIRSFPHVVEAVTAVVHEFGEASGEARVAKAIAILQVLDDLPATREHLAALLHPRVDASSEVEAVGKALDTLLAERKRFNLGEHGEGVRFLSLEALKIEQERQELVVPGAERDRLRTDVLKTLFQPLPQAVLEGARRIRAGLALALPGGSPGPAFEGVGEEVQVVLGWARAADFEGIRDDRLRTSISPGASRHLFWIGQDDERIGRALDDLYRTRHVAQRHRGKTADKEASDFVAALEQTAARLERDLGGLIERSLLQGSIVFRGGHRAASGFGTTAPAAANGALADALPRIYDRYALAPHQAESGLADAFLRADLKRVQTKTDPLSLVTKSGAIKTDHPALVALADHLRQHGIVEGSSLLDVFSKAPYGWSKDTTRYLVAALLMGGAIELRVAGKAVTHGAGDSAREALKSNMAFGRVGVSLRDATVDPSILVRASDRLLALTGEHPLPLEADVCKAALEHLPEFSITASALGADLSRYGLPGADRVRRVVERLRDALAADASAVPALLGAEQSDLYDDLKWVKDAHQRLAGDGAARFGEAHAMLAAFEALPNEGPAADLRARTADARTELGDRLGWERFFDDIPAVQTRVSSLRTEVEATGQALAAARTADLVAARERLESTDEWGRLGEDDRARLTERLDTLQPSTPPKTLDDVGRFLGVDGYGFLTGLRAIEDEVRRIGTPREPYRYPTPPLPPILPDSGASTAVALASLDDVPEEIDADSLDRFIERLRALVAEHGRLRLR